VQKSAVGFPSLSPHAPARQQGDNVTDPSSFTKLVPGFDFLQSLVKNAGAALPGIGQWVAPTIDPAEIEKRIEELRTVQFWLEQNARMIAATIQALEVQRMTLSTLKTMNVQMEDLRDSLQIRMPAKPAPSPAAPTPSFAAPVAPARIAEAPAPAQVADGATADAAPTAPKGANPGVVDPLQWWGALTKQFTELATTAMKDTGSDAARKLAAAMMAQSLDKKGAAAGATPDATASASAPARKTAAKKSARKRGAVAAKRAATKKPAPHG
jgi:hypothetical protein